MPSFEKLAVENPNVAFLHIDIDEMAGSIPELVNVRGVPTFAFYRRGNKVTEFSGADKNRLEAGVKAIAS